MDSNRGETEELSLALLLASREGNTDAVLRLIAEGANVTCCDEHHETPLHWASLRGHEETVQALLESGGDVHAQNNGGLTPLHFAAERKHNAVCRLLVLAGAKVTARDKTGATCRAVAAARSTQRAMKDALRERRAVLQGGSCASEQHSQAVPVTTEAGADSAS